MVSIWKEAQLSIISPQSNLHMCHLPWWCSFCLLETQPLVEGGSAQNCHIQYSNQCPYVVVPSPIDDLLSAWSRFITWWKEALLKILICGPQPNILMCHTSWWCVLFLEEIHCSRFSSSVLHPTSISLTLLNGIFLVLRRLLIWWKRVRLKILMFSPPNLFIGVLSVVDGGATPDSPVQKLWWTCWVVSRILVYLNTPLSSLPKKIFLATQSSWTAFEIWSPSLPGTRKHDQNVLQDWSLMVVFSPSRGDKLIAWWKNDQPRIVICAIPGGVFYVWRRYIP